ncbi:hypothetical protein COV04_04290 [Candidatus Uhrbacteria bacterium CG10_big_fil_rev_8_21_14_0_10_48_11]|uniref:Vitamin K epoxide reductase domain-containing protein n=1 Tax=Candidatus Uhrbacteria bacterium CG10_big_fil_rev_8_21_14_0_10_48_11 TaxID=1975037 RepID=A0A2M8LDI1_9BACT|nr:MAG: hypothetical protein COV04_04290 [Candidatus Uhrbacteria bacterium CG10_big_fil_rev_8_21_14_0_10_48_11]
MLHEFIILLLALAGLSVAGYIRWKKGQSHPFVCPIKFHCDAVVKSDYAKLFGIPVEVLGILYYAGIALSYTLFLLTSLEATTTFVMLVMFVSFVAFVFSLYLTAVQAFVLKQWCTWCLMSATICTLIFIASYIGWSIAS